MDFALEIACDESGWEGSNFATANSGVIAHASVRLDIDTAAEFIRAFRDRSGQHRYEYKASHLLRTKGGPDLAGFLGPSGPVHGRALVHLTHKSCFMLGRALDLFIGGSVDVTSLGLRPDHRLASLAATLCRAGPDTYGRQPWQAFLAATNAVLRVNRHAQVQAPVDAFFDQVEVLLGLNAAEILYELRDGRPQAYSARARLLEDHVLYPVLEPLIPSLVRTVLHWSRGLHPVAVVHDEQSALTERRMRRLEQILAAPPLEVIRLPAAGRFLRFRQVDSRTDPRVQVADLLAGVARKITTDELLGRGDPDLTALLRPYVHPGTPSCRTGFADAKSALALRQGEC
ncbi:MAG TPA: hypothetical protein VFC19_24825 [Candidatus Limnocylindrales bacterium]|nr:hypothetical protein [Candidatus Limnocylindrales bacterium]